MTKRVLSLLLALVMALSLCVPAFAAEGTGEAVEAPEVSEPVDEVVVDEPAADVAAAEEPADEAEPAAEEEEPAEEPAVDEPAEVDVDVKDTTLAALKEAIKEAQIWEERAKEAHAHISTTEDDSEKECAKFLENLAAARKAVEEIPAGLGSYSDASIAKLAEDLVYFEKNARTDVIITDYEKLSRDEFNEALTIPSAFGSMTYDTDYTYTPTIAEIYGWATLATANKTAWTKALQPGFLSELTAAVATAKALYDKGKIDIKTVDFKDVTASLKTLEELSYDDDPVSTDKFNVALRPLYSDRERLDASIKKAEDALDKWVEYTAASEAAVKAALGVAEKIIDDRTHTNGFQKGVTLYEVNLLIDEIDRAVSKLTEDEGDKWGVSFGTLDGYVFDHGKNYVVVNLVVNKAKLPTTGTYYVKYRIGDDDNAPYYNGKKVSTYNGGYTWQPNDVQVGSLRAGIIPKVGAEITAEPGTIVWIELWSNNDPETHEVIDSVRYVVEKNEEYLPSLITSGYDPDGSKDLTGWNVLPQITGWGTTGTFWLGLTFNKNIVDTKITTLNIKSVDRFGNVFKTSTNISDVRSSIHADQNDNEALYKYVLFWSDQNGQQMEEPIVSGKYDVTVTVTHAADGVEHKEDYEILIADVDITVPDVSKASVFTQLKKVPTEATGYEDYVLTQYASNGNDTGEENFETAASAKILLDDILAEVNAILADPSDIPNSGAGREQVKKLIADFHKFIDPNGYKTDGSYPELTASGTYSGSAPYSNTIIWYLEPKGDYDDLEDLIAYADTLVSEDYTAASWKLADLAAAIAAAKKVDAAQEFGMSRQIKIAAATEDLQVAVNKLALKTPDKKALHDLMIEVDAMEKGGYTADSVAALTAALKDAKMAYTKTGVRQSELNAAYNALNAAKNALVKSVDYAANVKGAIENAKTYLAQTDAYTAESLAALQTAVDAAQAVVDAGNVTEEAANKAVNDITEAIKNLKDAVKTDALQAAITAAEAALADTTKKYTAESKAAVETALADAKKVLADTAATQAAVDAAAKTLTDAVAALAEEVSPEPATGKGWTKGTDGKSWFYFVDGKAVKNKWVKSEKGLWYYLDENGVMATGVTYVPAAAPVGSTKNEPAGYYYFAPSTAKGGGGWLEGGWHKDAVYGDVWSVKEHNGKFGMITWTTLTGDIK